MKQNILKALPGDHPWQSHIYWYESLDSTNTFAKKQAADGAPHGTVILADHQSAGRGRLGRSFDSPAASGIYMSLILRPDCRPDRLMHLTCAVAVAMCHAVEKVCGFRPGIKWINDLVAGGKKLAGILTELGLNPKTGTVDYAIIGIGINCNQKPEDFPPELRSIACSAQMVSGKPADRAKLAAVMIQELETMSRTLENKDGILRQYRADCVTLGQEVRVLRGETCREGRALDVDADGGLTVRFADGTLETVNSGEVSVRGMFGYA